MANEIKSFAARDEVKDAVEVEEMPGSQADPLIYGIGAQILRVLGVKRIRLVTNHPRKIVGLQGYDIAVVEQIPLEPPAVLHSRDSSGARQNRPARILKSI